MECKKCGACCIALSISSPIPGMENGKPAGVRCFHLNKNNMCDIYYDRPDVCKNYTPSKELCSLSFHEAMHNLQVLEKLTK